MRPWGLGLSLMLVAGAARADDVPLGEVLEVQPGQCVDRESLVAQVETWLGRKEVDARIHVNVIASEGDMDTTFVVQRSKSTIGERRIRSTSMTCPEFRAALGLAIATAIDAGLIPGKPEEKPPPPPIEKPLPPPPAPVPAPVREQPKPNAPPSPLHFGLGADAIFTAGMLLDPAFGVAPAAHVSVLRWLELRGGAVVAFGLSPSSVGNGSVKQTIALATLEACFVQTLWQIRFRGCPGVWFGNISAQGSGFSTSLSANGAYAAGVLRFDAQIPKDTPIAFVAGVTPFFAPGQWSFEVSGRTTEPHKTEVGGVAATMGLQMRIF